MSIRNAAGAVQSKTNVLAMFTDVTPNENKRYRFDGTAVLYKAQTPDGTTPFENQRRKRFIPGQVYNYEHILAEFPDPTFTSIYVTATGAAATALPAAGGTAVTIKGTNLAGVTNVTFGATNATSIVVVDDQTVTCVTPAKVAGAQALVIVDDVNATLSGGNVTYV